MPSSRSSDTMDAKQEDLSVHVEALAVSESTWTVDEEKKVRRRLDFRVVPIVFTLYLLCFLDRANIGYVATRMLSPTD